MNLSRQFAAEKLALSPAEEAQTHTRHAAAYCTYLKHQAARLKGAQQEEALADLKTEAENLYTAWQWAVQQDTDPLSGSDC